MIIRLDLCWDPSHRLFSKWECSVPTITHFSISYKTSGNYSWSTLFSSPLLVWFSPNLSSAPTYGNLATVPFLLHWFKQDYSPAFNTCRIQRPTFWWSFPRHHQSVQQEKHEEVDGPLALTKCGVPNHTTGPGWLQFHEDSWPSHQKRKGFGLQRCTVISVTSRKFRHRRLSRMSSKIAEVEVKCLLGFKA